MKVAVIGMGVMGRRRIAAVRQYGYDVYEYDIVDAHSSSLRAGIESADAVIVCTPPSSHAHYIRLATAAEKPMLVEKPFCLASDIASIAPLLAVGDGRVIATGFNLRFHPTVVKSQACIGNRVVIAGTFVLSQYCPREIMLWPEWGSHEIDLAQYFLGPITYRYPLSTFPKCHHALSVVRHVGGAHSTIRVDSLGAPQVRRFELLLEDGETISGDLTFPTVSEQHYIDETFSFLRSLDEGAIEEPLATGADGLRVAEWCQ